VILGQGCDPQALFIARADPVPIFRIVVAVVSVLQKTLVLCWVCGVCSGAAARPLFETLRKRSAFYRLQIPKKQEE
jgi:hypothetical protein